MGTIQDVIDEYYLFDEDMEEVENGIYRGLVAGIRRSLLSLLYAGGI